MNSQQSKTYLTSKGSPEREVLSNPGQPKKDTNISNKQPNPILQELKERQQRQPGGSRRDEIIKIRAG